MEYLEYTRISYSHNTLCSLDPAFSKPLLWGIMKWSTYTNVRRSKSDILKKQSMSFFSSNIWHFKGWIKHFSIKIEIIFLSMMFPALLTNSFSLTSASGLSTMIRNFWRLSLVQTTLNDQKSFLRNDFKSYFFF